MELKYDPFLGKFRESDSIDANSIDLNDFSNINSTLPTTNSILYYDVSGSTFDYTSGMTWNPITSTLTVPNYNTQTLTLQSLVVSGSTSTGNTLIQISGSQGNIMSVTDGFGSTLWSVNDISGLPAFEVKSDDSIRFGDSQLPGLMTTKKMTINTGTTTFYSIPSSSYDGAFFEYTIKNGLNLRSGQIMSVWSGSSVNYTETKTTDLGSTTGFNFILSINSGNMIISTSAITSGWTVKSIIKTI